MAICPCPCGEEFTPRRATQKYATPACGSRARRAEQRRLREIVLAFFAEPPPEWRRCEECGQILHNQRKDARFCSTACRRGAARERRVLPGELGVADEPRDAHPLSLPAVRAEKPRTVRKPPPAPKPVPAQVPEQARDGYQNRAEPSQRRDRARIEDLRYVVRRWTHDEITPCTYCGLPATSQDHVLPRSYIATLADVDPELPKHMLIVVPACRECNTLAAALVFKTLREKRAYLRGRLEQRYAKALETRDFTRNELNEMGRDLRMEIEHAIALKAQTLERLAWMNRRVGSRRLRAVA